MTRMFPVTRGGGGKATKSGVVEQQVSLVDSVLSALRKSMASTCRVERPDQEVISAVRHMEIGWPTDVQHLTHVTFDRFHGFLGLPLEFEVQIPFKAPSARYIFFILDLMYCTEDIDVHCLAGLIKAWFRELPSGVLDGLSPEQVLECNTEEESVKLIKRLKPTEKALIDWAIDLMADVVDQQESNKMNARNIAMVFAPNMTQMLNPLTALRHAVQVMNLLKMLILKRLKEREKDSSRSSHFFDGEYDGQHETDTGYELAGRALEDDEQQDYYSSCNEDKDEVESLSKMEYCFLRQLDENENAKDGFRKQLERILCREHPSPGNNSTFNTDSRNQ